MPVIEREALAPDAKRKVLRSFTYGVHIATAMAEGGVVGAGTVTWLSQASFNPPLIMVGIKVGSRLHAAIDQSGCFAVHVVPEGQQDIAAAFLRPTQLEDGRINGYEYEPGPETGAPLLKDLPLWFEARVTDAVKRGDHTVFVAELVSCGVRDPEARPQPLRDTGWSNGG